MDRRKTNFISLLAFAFLMAAGLLEIPPKTMSTISDMVLAVIIFQCGIWGSRVIGFLLTRYAKKREKQEYQILLILII